MKQQPQQTSTAKAGPTAAARVGSTAAGAGEASRTAGDLDVRPHLLERALQALAGAGCHLQLRRQLLALGLRVQQWGRRLGGSAAPASAQQCNLCTLGATHGAGPYSVPKPTRRRTLSACSCPLKLVACLVSACPAAALSAVLPRLASSMARVSSSARRLFSATAAAPGGKRGAVGSSQGAGPGKAAWCKAHSRAERQLQAREADAGPPSASLTRLLQLGQHRLGLGVIRAAGRGGQPPRAAALLRRRAAPRRGLLLLGRRLCGCRLPGSSCGVWLIRPGHLAIHRGLGWRRATGVESCGRRGPAAAAAATRSVRAAQLAESSWYGP